MVVGMIIHAPFSVEEIKALHDHQERPDRHSYTCGNEHDEPKELIPLTDGWICPSCDYTQTWAHNPERVQPAVQKRERS